MRSRRLIFAGLAVLALASLPACKPTEDNYKKAYDVALQKRQKEAVDPDIVVPGGVIFQDEAPRVEMVDSVPVLFAYGPLKLIDGPGPLEKYNVVIATYKMTANARDHWERLTAETPAAALLQNEKQIYLVSIGAFKHKKDAVKAVLEYERTHKDVHYVGITEQRPVIAAASNVH